MQLRRLVFPIVILAFAAGGLSACSAKGTGDLAMLGMEHMPPEVQSAPVVVQQAYQFAAANPDVMQAIPCYCGCGSIGHTSNYSCYVSGQNADGGLKFDNHALGCSICVDITQDAMRLLREGRNPQEIRAYVDDTYGKYGTSNMP